MVARPALSILAIIFLAGGLLLQFFVVLSGTTTHKPENDIFFLQAATDGIPNARNPSRWTFFSICGVDGSGNNANCGSIVPALPFDPPNRHDFDTTQGVPQGFVGAHKYYYLSRFMFAFYLIAILFAGFALFTSLLALCTRIGALVSSMNVFIATGAQMIASALMTSWVIIGRNTFRQAGLDARIGKKGFAFTWAALACFMLSTTLFCLGALASRRSKRDHAAATSTTTTTRRHRGIFGRRRNHTTTNRGSYVGSDRGVKEDYA